MTNPLLALQRWAYTLGFTFARNQVFEQDAQDQVPTTAMYRNESRWHPVPQFGKAGNGRGQQLMFEFKHTVPQSLRRVIGKHRH